MVAVECRSIGLAIGSTSALSNTALALSELMAGWWREE
jgi:hypothetical protein